MLSLKNRKSHDEDRRSISIDADGILSYYNSNEKSTNAKNKSAWSKVKGIVTSRNPRKSVKSGGSINSRDVSPIDLIDERTDSISSSNQPSPSHNILDNEFAGTSSGCSHNQGSSGDDNDSKKQIKTNWVHKKTPVTRKFRLDPEIECLPEGVPLESKPRIKQIPNPLNLKVKYMCVYRKF